jgi:hypothetical protein
MSSRSRSRMLVCLVTSLLIPAWAAAQGFPRGGRVMPRPAVGTETATIKGKLKAMSGDVMQVGDDTINQYFVKLPGEAQQISLTGKALASWLKPGLLVRFVATVDAKGKIQNPVHKLDVITLRPPARQGEVPELPGVYPATAFGGGGALGGGDAPAAGGIGAGGGFGEKPAAGRGKEQSRTFKVIGQLTGLKNGEFAVAAGQFMLRGELQEDAEISVDIADYRYLQIGDEVEAYGWYYPQVPAQVQATKLTIKVAQPLGTAPDEKLSPKPEGKPRLDGRTKAKVKSKVKGKDSGQLPF